MFEVTSSNDASAHRNSVHIENPNSFVTNEQARKKTKAIKSITLIVIWTCLLYLLGMAPFLVSYILGFILQPSTGFTTYMTITSCILILSHGLTFFIYYKFNSLFRKVLISYVTRVFFFCNLFSFKK